MKSILSAVIGATLALSAIEAGAQATPGERQVSLTIETGTLANALDKWAQQSGFQIFVQDWEATKNLRAPSLKGTFAAQDALEQLLSGTPLTYVWIDAKTVSIRKKTAQTVPTALQRTSLDGHQAVPVAKFSGDDVGGASIPLAAAAAPSNGEGSHDLSSRVDQMEEVLVTGTHIRGVQNNTVPTLVMDKEYIASTGLSTTTRLMESLPQNFALTSQSGAFIPGTNDTVEQGSGVNLRGVGQGTTLVLLNGRRMAPGFGGSAVDISALPLSAIERVEIVTDGASALYGSDAVGGVVNFVLRRDFEGAETQMRSGWASGGLNEYRLSQLLGNSWDSGHVLLSMEYYKRDLLRAEDRDYIPTTTFVGSVLPEDKNYSGLISADQNITDDVSVFADALYTRRTSRNLAANILVGPVDVVNPQLNAAAGLAWKAFGDWQANVTGSYSKYDSNIETTSVLLDTAFEIEGAQVKLDGSLLNLPGGPLRMALGGEWRSESVHRSSIGLPPDEFLLETDEEQIVRSAFAEVYVPIVGEANARSGMQRLELSVAGRLDDYSNFGSSVDPQIGLMWEPTRGLRVRASHGTSYRAPNLMLYSPDNNSASVFFSDDPNVPSGESYQMQVFGNDAATFSAEESKSTSIGFELVPQSLGGFRLAANYYDIEYTDRLQSPGDTAAMLANPAAFGDLIIRNPTAAQINELIAFAHTGQGFFPRDENFQRIPEEDFDPSTVDVLIDARVRNLSIVETSGFDLALNYQLMAASSRWQFGLAGTYISKFEQRLTPTSQAFETVDTLYNPPDLRLRGSLGWQLRGLSVNAFVNYSSSYVDNRTPENVAIGSYTTVDMGASYDFGQRFASGFLSGITVSAYLQNAFDRDPPRVQLLIPFFDMGFDPTNASPLGRFFALEVTKSW